MWSAQKPAHDSPESPHESRAAVGWLIGAEWHLESAVSSASVSASAASASHHAPVRGKKEQKKEKDARWQENLAVSQIGSSMAF